MSLPLLEYEVYKGAVVGVEGQDPLTCEDALLVLQGDTLKPVRSGTIKFGSLSGNIWKPPAMLSPFA